MDPIFLLSEIVLNCGTWPWCIAKLRVEHEVHVRIRIFAIVITPLSPPPPPPQPNHLPLPNTLAFSTTRIQLEHEQLPCMLVVAATFLIPCIYHLSALRDTALHY